VAVAYEIPEERCEFDVEPLRDADRPAPLRLDRKSQIVWCFIASEHCSRRTERSLGSSDSARNSGDRASAGRQSYIRQSQTPWCLPPDRHLPPRPKRATGDSHSVAYRELVETTPGGPIAEEKPMVVRPAQRKPASRSNRDRLVIRDDVTIVNATPTVPVRNEATLAGDYIGDRKQTSVREDE
jgi:hypothetical protein